MYDKTRGFQGPQALGGSSRATPSISVSSSTAFSRLIPTRKDTDGRAQGRIAPGAGAAKVGALRPVLLRLTWPAEPRVNHYAFECSCAEPKFDSQTVIPAKCRVFAARRAGTQARSVRTVDILCLRRFSRWVLRSTPRQSGSVDAQYRSPMTSGMSMGAKRSRVTTQDAAHTGQRKDRLKPPSAGRAASGRSPASQE